MAALRREFIFVFVITVFSLTVHSEAFTSFWFVQQWPPAVCSFQRGTCKGAGLRSFTIHGLWPQQGSRSITNCNGNLYDKSKITSALEMDLNRVWPDVISGNNDNFWMKQWDKHGICSESSFRQEVYFQLAVDLRNNIDIFGALRTSGITPNGQLKSPQRVESAILTRIGVVPVLRCKTSPSGGSPRLVEIVICIGSNGRSLISCNSAAGSCKTSFIF